MDGDHRLPGEKASAASQEWVRSSWAKKLCLVFSSTMSLEAGATASMICWFHPCSSFDTAGAKCDRDSRWRRARGL